jgi:hypothetical protein
MRILGEGSAAEQAEAHAARQLKERHVVIAGAGRFPSQARFIKPSRTREIADTQGDETDSRSN